MKEIQVGLLGCGTVGTGVAKLLINSRQVIRARLGTTLNLKRVADIDIETDRGVQFDEGVLTTDANALVNDPEIDIIIEMIGGEGIAKELILKAIDNGKQVITANKALLATRCLKRLQKKVWIWHLRPQSADVCRPSNPCGNHWSPIGSNR
jgi:homoserine dehydrogenase